MKSKIHKHKKINKALVCKKTIILMGILCGLGLNAQWSLTGNTGTTPGTNFIGTKDAKDLVFKTNNLERMRVFQNGNIYIGDSSYINYYGINTNNTFVTAGTSSFYLTNNTNAFRITDASIGWNYFRVAASDEYDSIVYLQEDGGKVLIGGKSTNLYNCATCTDYKLFVKDGIRTEKVKVDVASTAGWADYVFAKDYKLMPLHEVKKYIDENQHLPEVPSAEDVVANGVELKEMTTLLLKKIEELTLYTIDQQKQIDELKKTITEKK